ncbi:S-layer homology domain-containing protein [Moorellaceae bacterium AZ2]
MLRRNLGIFLVLTLGVGFLLVGQAGTQAVAEVTYAVYNESQGTYFSDLQAALNGAQTGDVIRVVADKATFNSSLNWKVDGITLDLNGAVITAPGGQNTITVAETVNKLDLRNGVLRTSDMTTSCIEAPGSGSTPLEIKLENMEIYGEKSIYFKRNGRLEWSGGKASGRGYGVLIDSSVQDFTALFNGVTFERGYNSSLYFSGKSSNNPVTSFKLEGCRFGEKGNPLAGPVLWVETGTTTVEINACTVEAGGSTRDLVRIQAAGSVTVVDSHFHRDRGAVISLGGVTDCLLAGNEITTAAGYSETSYSPAIRIESSSRSEILTNRLTGPGVQGIRIVGGTINLEGNYIANFVDGAYFQQSELKAVNNIITAYGTGFVLRDMVGGQLEGNELGGRQDFGGITGISIQSGGALDLVDNMIQGWSTGLLASDNAGIRVAGSAFRYNGVGVRLSNTTGAVLEHSVWEGNDTGLRVSGDVEADIHDNIIISNGTGVDFSSMTGGRLQFTRNDLYRNSMGVQAPSGITLAAPHNYWGSSSGLHHEVSNPQGRGEKVTGDLDFTPWSPYAYGEDNLPPQVDLFLPAGVWLENEPLPLEISLTEETLLDRVNLAVYGPEGEVVGRRSWWADEWAAQGQPLKWETRDLEDGLYCLEVAAVDGKGNVGRDEGCLLLDRHPPSHPWIYINGGAAETASLTVQLTLGAQDVSGIAEMMLRNEGETHGEWEPYQPVKMWELSPGPAGLRQVIVRFRDGSGWVSAEARASIVFNSGNGGSGETEEKEEVGHPGEGDSAEDHEKGKGPLPGRDASTGDTSEKYHVENAEGEYGGGGQDAIGLTFSDVPKGHWAWSDIMALAPRGLFQEGEQGKFFPERPLTRGELADLLDRALLFSEGPERDWVDVPPDSPYRGAVGRVTGAGIMVGYEDGSFRPESPVSREEAVVTLVRAAKDLGVEGTGSGVLREFVDLREVAPWAYNDVLWALEEGLLRGYPDGSLRPRDSLTRAEAAALIRRFLYLTFPA